MSNHNTILSLFRRQLRLFFKHLCICKRMQLLFKCVGIGVYKRCESANLERCQLTLRKKDKLMANVSFDQEMEFYISVVY